MEEFNIGGEIAIDDLCTDASSFVCGMAEVTACFIICNLASIGGCSWICAATCSGFCSGMCSIQCGRLGPLAYFCEKYACAPACATVCGPILSMFCKI
ncbi:MAG: hypothetical protein QXD49_08565 [Archaeoglobaceae archaeon]